MSHQDKASRVSIFPLSGRAWWKVFRLHFHYVPFISGASVFPARGVEWPGGRAAPSPSGQKRPKVVAPSPRTSRPPAGPPATTSLSPRPLFRGRQRSEAVTGPRLRVRRADRGGERRATTIGASRGSFRFFPRHRGGREEAGKNAAPREPPAGGPVTAARRAPLPRALARSPSVGSAFESEIGSSGGTCFSLTHRKRGL